MKKTIQNYFPTFHKNIQSGKSQVSQVIRINTINNPNTIVSQKAGNDRTQKRNKKILSQKKLSIKVSQSKQVQKSPHYQKPALKSPRYSSKQPKGVQKGSKKPHGSKTIYTSPHAFSQSQPSSLLLSNITQSQMDQRTYGLQTLVDGIQEEQFGNLHLLKLKVLGFIFRNRVVRDQQYDQLFQMVVTKFPNKHQLFRAVLFQIVTALDS